MGLIRRCLSISLPVFADQGHRVAGGRTDGVAEGQHLVAQRVRLVQEHAGVVSRLDSQQRQVEILGPEMLGDDLPSDRSPRPVDIDRLVGPGGLDHVCTGQYQPRRHEEAGPLIPVPRQRQPDGTAVELVVQPGLVHGGRP